MNAWLGCTSSPVFGLPSGPSVISGSSGFSGTNTVPPDLTVWSTPWSKNWPKKVNSELYGGDRPTSVVTFGMKRVWCVGTQPAGTPATGGTAVGSGSTVQGCTPGFPWVRTGNSAAAIAAGLVEVWSTIRLEITRGWESMTTFPASFWAYEVGPGGPTGSAAVIGSAARKFGLVNRGKGTSAAANVSRPGNRLLQDPSTVRRPNVVSRSGIWSGAVPTRVPQGSAAVAVAACRSAILICFRMKVRSPAVTTNPLPTGAAADADCGSRAALAVASTTAQTATPLTPGRRRRLSPRRPSLDFRMSLMTNPSPGMTDPGVGTRCRTTTGPAMSCRPSKRARADGCRRMPRCPVRTTTGDLAADSQGPHPGDPCPPLVHPLAGTTPDSAGR